MTSSLTRIFMLVLRAWSEVITAPIEVSPRKSLRRVSNSAETNTTGLEMEFISFRTLGGQLLISRSHTNAEVPIDSIGTS